MLYLTSDELIKVQKFLKKERIDNEVTIFTDQILELYEEMLIFAQKSNNQELFKRIDFQGFYCQAEPGDYADYYNYAMFLIFKLNKFQVLKSKTQYETIKFDIWQSLSKYEKQLKIWKKYHKPNSDKMLQVMIKEIIEA